QSEPGDKKDLRGFEWRYFWRLLHQDQHTFTHQGKASIFAVAFALDDKTLASSDGNGIIHLWDLGTQREITSLNGHQGGVMSLAFCPTDSHLLASAGQDRMAKLWNVATDRVMAKFPHTDEVYSVAFTRDGKTLATSARNGEVRLWNVASY